MKRPAFSIIELLVALGVIAILAAITLPAIVKARESSRRAACTSHLRQIGTAIAAYEATHRMLPPGHAFRASMHVAILPYIDHGELYSAYDFIRRDGSAVMRVLVPLYVCPSDPAASVHHAERGPIATTSYAGNCGTGVTVAGYNGLFRPLVSGFPGLRDGPVRLADVRDGLSSTAAVCDILHADGSYDRLRVNWSTPQEYLTQSEFPTFCAVCSRIPPNPTAYGWRGNNHARGKPWTDGNLGHTMYNHALPPNSPSCTNGTLVQQGIYSAASAHEGGVNMLLGDGHVRFIAASVDSEVWREYGSRVADERLER